MSHGLLWLALADLGQAWLRSGLAALAIAAAILAIAFFAGQIQLHQREVLASYEAAGAATFIVRLTGVADDEIDALAGSVRTISDVRSAEAPYSGISSNIAVDTSFLVFRNEQQQEYLGARTRVLGVDRNFDLARDYYVDFHEINPQAPQMVLGMPLLVTTGEARPPGPQEVLVPSGVADYVGVPPGAEAIVEFVYSGPGEPIIQRFDGLRLIGTFDMAGPDQGRFEPFWRFNANGQDVLTVRAEAARIGSTSLPIVVNRELFRDFLAVVARELMRRGSTAALVPARDQLVVRASSIGNVPVAEAAVERVLHEGGLDRECDARRGRSVCLRLPERNNFWSALQEQEKVGGGGAFFVALLLILLAFGTAGLQVQSVVSRWRDYGILQAVGFTPRQVLVYYALQFALVLTSGIAIAAIASVPLSTISAISLIVAAVPCSLPVSLRYPSFSGRCGGLLPRCSETPHDLGEAGIRGFWQRRTRGRRCCRGTRRRCRDRCRRADGHRRRQGWYGARRAGRSAGHYPSQKPFQSRRVRDPSKRQSAAADSPGL